MPTNLIASLIVSTALLAVSATAVGVVSGAVPSAQTGKATVVAWR